MKLLRYGPKGQEKPGILDNSGQIRDLSGIVADIDGKVLSDLSAIRAAKIDSLPVVDKNVRIAEPVARVGKFICIGLNYSDHAKESGMPEPAEPTTTTGAGSRRTASCVSSKKMGLSSNSKTVRLGSGCSQRRGVTSVVGSTAGSVTDASVDNLVSSIEAPRRKRDFS